MYRIVRGLLIILFAAVLIGAPYQYHRFVQSRYRNFRIVTPEVLYRSGQLNPAGLKQIIHDYGIRTVITLREDDGVGPDPNQWEEAYCRNHALAYARILPRNWWIEDGRPPAEEPVADFLEVLRDPKRYPRPILLHCFAGIHRTGAFAAIYRMEFERWSPDEAIDEMKRCGYQAKELAVDWDLESFLRLYQPEWRRYLAPGEHTRGVAARPPVYSPGAK